MLIPEQQQKIMKKKNKQKYKVKYNTTKKTPRICFTPILDY